jgi:hypothetical protein
MKDAKSPIEAKVLHFVLISLKNAFVSVFVTTEGRVG